MKKRKNPKSRARRFTVVKLGEEERRLMKNLARRGGVADRYTALLELVPIVKALTAKDVAKQIRAIRLGLPDSLDAALTAKRAELGKPAIRLLILAARRWLDMRRKQK